MKNMKNGFAFRPIDVNWSDGAVRMTYSETYPRGVVETQMLQEPAMWIPSKGMGSDTFAGISIV